MSTSAALSTTKESFNKEALSCRLVVSPLSLKSLVGVVLLLLLSKRIILLISGVPLLTPELKGSLPCTICLPTAVQQGSNFPPSWSMFMSGRGRRGVVGVWVEWVRLYQVWTERIDAQHFSTRHTGGCRKTLCLVFRT